MAARYLEANVPRGSRFTGAMLDRLTHHVHILEMNGESYRLNQSKQRHRLSIPGSDKQS